jgi:hypothetical protein
MVFREFIKHTFHYLVEAVLRIISFTFCWSMDVQNNDMTPANFLLSVITVGLSVSFCIAVCKGKEARDVKKSAAFQSFAVERCEKLLSSCPVIS